MSGEYQQCESVDHLVLAGGSILLFDDHFTRLSPLGAYIFMRAEEPQTIDSLAAALTAVFGAPTHGSTVEATRVAVASLVEQGVLQKADDG